jgi:hypothetical protein
MKKMRINSRWVIVAALVLVFGLVLALASGSVKTALLCLGALPLLALMGPYTDVPQYSFKQNVTDALVGKEGQPLELVAGTLNVQLYNAGIPIGVMFERLEGSQAVKVNLRGPIRKAVATGAINSPAYVKWAAGGIAAGGSGDKCCGVAIYPYVCAAGDLVSFIETDCIMP